MYTSYRVDPYDYFQTAFELDGVGKVTVVCGKNNSGKSTFLRALEKRMIPGVATSIGTAQAASDKYRQFLGTTGANDRNLLNAVNELCRRHFGETLLYRDGAKLIGDAISNEWQRDVRTRNYGLNLAVFTQFLDSLFPIELTPIMVGPKRNIESSVSPTAPRSLNPNGFGLLNWVFRAQNAHDSEDAWIKLHALRDVFRDVSAGWDFVGKMVADEVILHFVPPGQLPVAASQCGQGLQELLAMLYFASVAPNNIVIIEEPENHVHPEMQRRFLAYLSSTVNKQFFLSTHSSVLLDNSFVDTILLTKLDDGIKVADATSKAVALDDMGYSIVDNLVSDLVILVEGPHDVSVYKQLLILRGVIPKSNIKFWPLGGDNMAHVDLSVLTQSQQVIAVVDREGAEKSQVIREQFLENCEALDIAVTRLERYAVENYFPLRIIADMFRNEVPEGFEDLAPDISVKEQLGFTPKRKSRQIAQAMTWEDVAHTDLGAFILSVEEACSAAS